jgi:ATP-dependent DNA helicase RecG
MIMQEGFTVEFKREYAEDIKKEVVAFANSQGGTIFVGVEDDGGITGVDHPDAVLLQIVNSVRNFIKPDVSMFTDSSVIQEQERSIIRVTVQRGTDRPYYISEKGLRPAGVYVRQGSASVPASEDAIRQMIKETDGDKYEAARSLNQELAFQYASAEFEKQGLVFGEAQWKTLGLLSMDGLFTNLGLLLSDQCLHTVKIARFEGVDKGIFKDRREFGGSLFKQLAEVYAYIDLYNKTNATFSGLDRIENRDYPEDAIREALMNAIVHREYSYSGSTLINVFDDRIEFVSLGGIVAGLTMDDIMLGISQARNEKLAGIFYRLKHIEAYGTGIIKILSAYRTNAVKPDIKSTDNAFMVVLPNRNAVSVSEMTFRTPENAQFKTILDYLARHGTVTRNEIERLLQVKQSRAVGIVREMMAGGLIFAEGSGRNTRYRRR